MQPYRLFMDTHSSVADSSSVNTQAASTDTCTSTSTSTFSVNPGADCVADCVTQENFNSANSQDSLNTKTLKQIFQLSPIGMTVLDLGGRFLSANQSFCEAVGYAEYELIALSFKDLTHREDVPLLCALGQQLLAGKQQHFQVETRHWTQDKSPLNIGLTVTMVRDAQQRPICFLLQVVNLTEQRWMEAELRHRDFYDGLTGLANRALFVNRVEQAILRLERHSNAQCAVLFLDLDRFKVVNDSLGLSLIHI